MKRPSLSQILAVVAEETRLASVHITGPMRFPKYVNARHAFAHAARGWGYGAPTIGVALNRHRTTIFNSLLKDPARIPHLSNIVAKLAQREAA